MTEIYRVVPRDPDAPSPKEKMTRYGAQSLATTELLALVLKTGTREKSPLTLAELLLKRCGGLRGVAKADVKELSRIKGIGPLRGLQIAACMELGRRLAARTSEPNPIIRSPEDLADLLMPSLLAEKKEHFLAVLLDTKNRVIRVHTVSVGTLDASLVHPREVFKEAISASAASLIVAHNHPSGDPTPSPEDKQVTARLVEAGKLLGIDVLDHLVLGDERWVSLKERGLM